MPTYRHGQRDHNHHSVLQAAVDVGAVVFDLHQLGGALDAIVGFRGVLYWVEIKAVGRREKLTPAERDTIQRFRAVGCPMLVVETKDELLKGIGAV